MTPVLQETIIKLTDAMSGYLDSLEPDYADAPEDYTRIVKAIEIFSTYCYKIPCKLLLKEKTDTMVTNYFDPLSRIEPGESYTEKKNFIEEQATKVIEKLFQKEPRVLNFLINPTPYNNCVPILHNLALVGCDSLAEKLITKYNFPCSYMDKVTQTTPIMFCIALESTKLATIMYHHMDNLNDRDISYHTALSLAVIHQNIELVKLFLSKSSKLVILDALEHAEQRGFFEIIKIIKEFLNRK
jgi:ankyrin repeat protein